MLIFKSFFLSVAGVLGSGATITSGLYLHSYESIGDKVQDEAIPEENIPDSVWQKVKGKIISVGDELKDEDIKAIKQKSPDTNIEDIKNGCLKTYKKTYKSIFEAENKELLNDTKKICVIKIKDIVEGTKILKVEDNEEDNKDNFKSNLKKLQDHKPLDILLPKELLDLKEKIKDIEFNNDEEQGKKLRSGCKNIYEDNFQGENKDAGKLTQRFCLKD